MSGDTPTETEQATDALARTLLETRAGLLDESRDAIVVDDHAFRFLSVNAEAARQMQRPLHDVVGQTLWESFGETAAPFRETLTRALRESDPLTFETEHTPRGGLALQDGTPAVAIFSHDVIDRHAADRSPDAPSLVARLVAGVDRLAHGGRRDDICVLAGMVE